MLFHVTATHTPDDCPGYNQDNLKKLLAGSENVRAKAQELNVKVHFSVNAAPEHVAYLLLEADDPYSVALFVTAMPFKQDFKVSAVEYQQEVTARAKEYYRVKSRFSHRISFEAA